MSILLKNPNGFGDIRLRFIFKHQPKLAPSVRLNIPVITCMGGFGVFLYWLLVVRALLPRSRAKTLTLADRPIHNSNKPRMAQIGGTRKAQNSKWSLLSEKLWLFRQKFGIITYFVKKNISQFLNFFRKNQNVT